MKRLPLDVLSMCFGVVLLVCVGISAAIRVSIVGSRESEIAQVKEENKKAKEQFDYEVGMLREAKERGTDEGGTVFKHLLEALQTPEFADKKVTDVMAKAKQLRQIDEALLHKLDPSKSWGPLWMMGADQTVNFIMNYDKNHPLTDILRGTIDVPQPELVLKPVPGPLPYFDRMYLLRAWGVISIIIALVYLYVPNMALKEYHPFKQFPRHRPIAWVYFTLIAPGSVPVLLVYGGYRACTTDWEGSLDRAWKRVQTFGYRHRLLRKLPAPVLTPAGLLDLGALAIAHPVEVETRAPSPVTAPVDPATPHWYIFHADVFRGLEHVLRAADIKLYALTIKQPGQRSGYAVPANGLTAFLETLRITDAEMSDEETDIELTVWRNYKRRLGKRTVVNFEAENEDLLKRILATVSAYAGGIDLRIEGHNGGYVALATEDGCVHIHYYASPRTGPTARIIEWAFGRSVEGSKVSLVPPDETRTGEIIQDYNGNPVAQVIEGDIYILISGLLGLADTSNWSLEALAKLLHEAVAVALRQREGETDASTIARWKATAGQQREKYVELCFTRFDRKRKELESEIAAHTKDVVDLGLSLTKTLKLKKEAEVQHQDVVERGSVIEKERLRKEFEQLAASACVIDVRCLDDGIQVKTRTVHISWMDKRFRIGRFQIDLFDNGGISLKNVANTAKGTTFHHPHIPTEGRACFGNLQESLSKLMAERQYAVVVSMLFRYLENYNPHNGVEKIDKWKEVGDETND